MPEPLYRRIADDLFQKIDSGELGHGEQLPTEIELRDTYVASRNTVRDAIKWLISRGLVETRPGQGTFVVDKIDPFVTAFNPETGFGVDGEESAAYASEVTTRNRIPTITPPRVEIKSVEGVIASELQLGDDVMAVSRHQQRFIDGRPWSMQTTFYPMRFVSQGASRLLQAEDISGGVVRYLEQELGIKQAGWRDKITVRAPDQNEATFFKLPDDGRIAVFEFFRTAFEESGEPLRLTVTVFPADRNQFVMHVGQVPEDVLTTPPDKGGDG